MSKQNKRKFSKLPSFKNTEHSSVITEFALALTAVKNEEYHPSGTAIIIAPFLAISARHVMEDYVDKFESFTINDNSINYEGTFSLIAVQFIGDKNAAIWNITKVTTCQSTDICYLRLSPGQNVDKNYKWRIPKIDFSIPKIGDRISGFGYSESNIIFSDNVVEWSHFPATTIGEVLELHEEKRDINMLNFPCFMVNARFDGGMSGGPVFNDNGYLCGLICSNLPPSESDQQHVSYVTLLWPALGVNLDLPYDKIEREKSYPALLLVQENIINGIGVENLFIKDGMIGFKTKVSGS